jgi:hypothetical protein
MKIRQIVKENVGVEWNGAGNNKYGQPPKDGYQHHDALWFPGGNENFLEEYHISQKPWAQFIYENIVVPRNVQTILELGSGAGSLAYFLRKFNPNLVIVTLDGNKESISSPYISQEHHFVVRTDEKYELVNENDDIILFDLILSFEHFEHIIPENLNIFFDNIVKHTSKSSYMLASASKQTGGFDWHPSIFQQHEWKEMLKNHGFILLFSDLFKRGPTPFNFNWKNSVELFCKRNHE